MQGVCGQHSESSDAGSSQCHLRRFRAQPERMGGCKSDPHTFPQGKCGSFTLTHWCKTDNSPSWDVKVLTGYRGHLAKLFPVARSFDGVEAERMLCARAGEAAACCRVSSASGMPPTTPVPHHQQVRPFPCCNSSILLLTICVIRSTEEHWRIPRQLCGDMCFALAAEQKLWSA